MIGNDLLLDRVMRAHRDRLLEEGQERQLLAELLRIGRPAPPRRRSGLGARLAGGLGGLLVRVGRRLQARAQTTPRLP